VIVAAQTMFAATARAASLGAFPSEDLLGVPLELIFLLTIGLRLAFEIPAPLRANWAFQLGVDPATRGYRALAKRVMITFVLPVLVASFGAYAYFWDWRVALVHTVVTTVMSVLLIDTLLLRFRKIPFTCSAPPFKDTTIVMLVLGIVGFSLFSSVVPGFEWEAVRRAFPYDELIAFVLVLWSACLTVARFNETEFDRRLIFDDRLPPTVEPLDLTFRR
jgi:hypothetical protein